MCETRIFQDNQVNTMADDALAPCVPKTSAVMVLALQIKQVIFFHEQRFQLLLPSHF